MKYSRMFAGILRSLAVATAIWSLTLPAGLLANATRPVPDKDWVTAWTTSTFAENPGKDTPALEGATFRQVVQVTLSAKTVRVRVGNFFGKEPLEVGGVSIGPDPAAGAGSHMKTVLFAGKKSVSVPPGETVASDPVRMDVKALENLAVDMYLAKLPKTLTVHSTSRATSYVTPGNTLDGSATAAQATRCTRWYFLCDIEAVAPGSTAISIFGDSIADGNGIPDDSYARWLNVLSRRVQAETSMRNIAVLNSSIGTNCLLRDGMTPRALSRVYRDVFDLRGVRTVVIALGVNDLGTGHYARREGKEGASVGEIVGAITKITSEAHDRGMYVIGTTITPYKGADFYWDEQGEADRVKVNDWIRKTDIFDGMADFDAVVRNPEEPARLRPEFDKGDHLHLSVAGYKAVGDAVPLDLLHRFATTPRKTAVETLKQ